MSAASAVAGFPPHSAVAAFRVYVWQLPVRISHWLIALSVAVLAVTGFYIGDPFIIVSGPARDHFVMGWMKVIHYYAAIVFTLAVLTRIAWMFAGNRYARWNQLIPTTRVRLGNLVRTFKFYTFLRPRPPITVGHNPLAGAIYVVVFALYLLMIATGLALYSQSAAIGSPMHAFRFLIPILGGLQSARWIHHVGMWLLLGFVINHIYSSVMFSAVERNATLESIFTGYKFVRPAALEETLDDE